MDTRNDIGAETGQCRRGAHQSVAFAALDVHLDQVNRFEPQLPNQRVDLHVADQSVAAIEGLKPFPSATRVSPFVKFRMAETRRADRVFYMSPR